MQKAMFGLYIILFGIGMFLVIANIILGVGLGIFGGVVILGYSSYMLYKNRGAFKKAVK